MINGLKLSRSGFLKLGASAVAASSLGLTAPTTLAAQRSSDPDSEALDLLLEDDTAGVVDVWEEVFADAPYDDDIRESLVIALTIDILRSFDKGLLRRATKSYERLLEVAPTGDNYEYIEECLRRYVANKFTDNMENEYSFSASTDPDFESRYVNIPNIFTAQTNALALTEKQQGQFNYYYLGSLPNLSSFAFRSLMYPMSSNGYIVIIFGYKDEDNFYALTISYSYGSTSEWLLNEFRNGTWQGGISSGYVDFQEKTWHPVEIRVYGQTFELWVDYSQVTKEIVIGYETGYAGFGVGLPNYSNGTTFSTAFDDLSIYTIK